MGPQDDEPHPQLPFSLHGSGRGESGDKGNVP